VLPRLLFKKRVEKEEGKSLGIEKKKKKKRRHLPTRIFLQGKGWRKRREEEKKRMSDKATSYQKGKECLQSVTRKDGGKTFREEKKSREKNNNLGD